MGNGLKYLPMISIAVYLCLQTASNAQEETRFKFPDEIIPIVDLDAFGTYSNPNSGGDVWGAIVTGSMAPIIKFNDDLYLIPLYDGSFRRQKFFSHTEEGGRSYDEVQHHDLSATLKYLFADKLTIGPQVFCGWDLNVETDDEDWGSGLYDYMEFGGGTDADYTLYKTPNGEVVLSGGWKFYNRHYPNYESLISLAAVTAPEKDEKDFNALELSAGWRFSRLETFSAGMECRESMKFFTDKKVIDADGVLEDKKRKEYRHSISADLSYSPAAGRGFIYDLSAECGYTAGNQNFYDSRGTVVLTDDVYTPDYFDHFSAEFNPCISYIFKSGEKTVLALSGEYDLLIRLYSERKAQLMGGMYSDDEQRDYEHTFGLRAEVPVDEHLSWVTSYDYTISDSNMDYEEFYEYNYTMHRIMTGASLSY